MIADAEELLTTYLAARETVAALGARIVGETPADRDTPWVRITQLDAQQDPSSRHDHLVAFFMQLDCYAGKAGGQEEASLLRRTVRAALQDIASAAHADGVVVTGARVNGDTRIPDHDFKPVRERFVLAVTVWAHS